jgi:hypothetical protein
MKTYAVRYRDGIGRWSVAYIQAINRTEALCIAFQRGYFPINAD